MNQISFRERIWYQSHVPVFLEKVAIPIIVGVVTTILLVNPMKIDWQSRISVFVALLALGYFISHQLHLRNESIRTAVKPSTVSTDAPPPTPPPHVSGPASTTGPDSPAVTGDGNSVTYDEGVKKQPPKQPQK
jgi:hypothetical protein